MNWKQGLYFGVLVVLFFSFSLLLGTDPVWIWGSATVYAIYIAMDIVLREIKKLRDYIDINPNKNEENK